MDAIRPGGTVKIHPYVLLKVWENPQVFQKPEVRARLQRVWRPSRLSTMQTEEIEARLDLTGAPYDRAEFIEETRNRTSAWEIGESWGAGLAALSEGEKNFLGLAACELWRRLCPDRPSLEMLDDLMCEGYAHSDARKHVEAVTTWWKLWEALRPRITPAMKDLDQAGELVFPGMSQCLSNWAGDFRLEALNGSLHDTECGETGIRFLREMTGIFPENSQDLNAQGDIATILFQLGRDSEAEAQCQELIRLYPDRATGYVMLSDGLLRRFQKNASDPSLAQRAVRALEDAIARPAADLADYDVAHRLAEAREQLAGKKADA